MTQKRGKFRVLEALNSATGRHGLTSADVQRCTGLSRRTVYGIMRELDRAGLLERRTSLRDARQTYVRLKPVQEDERAKRRAVDWCLTCDHENCLDATHRDRLGIWRCELCQTSRPCTECRRRNP